MPLTLIAAPQPADAGAGYTRAIHTGHNYRKHEEIARYVERQLGHDHVQGAHAEKDGQPRPPRTPTHAQYQQAERGGVSAKEAKALGAQLWKATDSGKALNAALEERGWLLARGDKTRSDGGAYFMAIDPGGEAHELRRMMPVKAAALYARMAEIDAASLPSVRAAKTFQRERPAPNEQRKAAEMKHGGAHVQLSVAGAAPAAAPQANDSRKRKMAIEREDATDPKTVQRQIDDQQDLAARAKEQTELSERFLAGLQRDHEDAEKVKEADLAARQAAVSNDDIADARRRYLQAAEHYDIRRPYASLSEIAGIEGATLRREQERLKREAALERDPDKRELIDLRRQIEANDYMAITSQRLSEMSKVITGNSNSEESQRQAARAEYFAAEALELRRQRQELHEQINQRDGDRDGRSSSTVREQQPEPAAPPANQNDRDKALFAGSRGSLDPTKLPPLETFRPTSTPQPGRYDELRLDAASQTHDAEAELGSPERDAVVLTALEAIFAYDRMESSPEAEQTPEPAASPATEAEHPAEMIHLGPTAPERDAEPATAPERENTDARQGNSAENAEITDSKAAKKAALAQMRTETEQSIEQAGERGFGHSR